MPDGAAQRIELVDALRGVALMGIVQVNIQCFTWGSGNVLGYLRQPPGDAESALYFLQSALVEGKFYPMFAFLFGAGVVLQLRKARRGGLGRAAARAIQRRRLAFLFVAGLLHGTLLYCGDVLSAYAVCGLIFLPLAGARPRSLVRFAWGAGLAAVLSLFVPMGLDRLAGSDGGDEGEFESVSAEAGATQSDDEAAGELPDSIVSAHEIYVHGGFAAQWPQRLEDELWQQVGTVPTFWPQVIALFALGALAGRLGWLARPGRHPHVWRWALRIGLGTGLPFALLGAAMDLAAARATPGAEDAWVGVAVGLGSLLSAAYVAGTVRALGHPNAAPLRRALALAGRMSLSNYLMQSLVMAALLTGWGLGWGADATRGQLAALGLLIFGLELLWSRWWLGRHRQGPMEALWRRWTYRTRPASAAGPPSG
jgi:uncharacterized protein